MKNKHQNYLFVACFLFGIVLLAGWALNIIDIAYSTKINGYIFFRFLGILIAPLGAILGYF